MTNTTPSARAIGRRSGTAPRRRSTADKATAAERRFVRLAEDVLDRRDRNRRGGTVAPDAYGRHGRNALDVPDPTGIAAVRRLTGDVPHDPVAARLAEDERDLARLADRLGATTHIRNTCNP